MRPFLLATLATALLTGCAAMPPGGGEPAFCVASLTGRGGPLTRAITDGSAQGLGGLRSLRLLSEGEAPDENCDVTLKISEGVAETGPYARLHLERTGQQPNCSITAFSVYTGAQIWNAMTAAPECTALLVHLRNGFQPGTPDHANIRIPADRRRGPDAPSGASQGI